MKPNFHEQSRLERQRIFELLLFWEGRCNSTTISNLLCARRESVSQDIKAYRDKYTGQAEYDSIAKVYRPGHLFQPILTTGNVAEYIEHKRRFDQADSAELFCVDAVSIPPDPVVFRLVQQAIANRERIKVFYRSLNHPAGRERVIRPHALVYAGIRWHCRAFDELTGEYRDFNLHRCRNLESLGAICDEQELNDVEWSQFVQVELAPNPALSEQEQALVAADYGIENGSTLKIAVRRALVMYTLQRLQVKGGDTTEPRAMPLVEILAEPPLNRT